MVERDQALESPGLPKRAGLMQPDSNVESLADDLLGVAGELSDDFIAPEQIDIECTALRDASGTVQVLTVANHGGENRAEITLPSGFRDLYSGDAIVPDGSGTAVVSLKERQVRLFVSDD